tara:strand:- start:267 stop:785 length:519 start_codon:yes stop_codon:yes gene_type:complete
MKKTTLGITVVVVSFIILVFYYGLNTEKIYDTEDLVGKPIPKIDLKLLNESKNFNTEELSKNNFTLINFFASWCGPCRKEHKHLINLSKNKNIKIFGINLKDEKSQANKFLNKLGNPYYLIASDHDGKKAIHFGVFGIPETILIDNDLNIIKKYIGPIDDLDVKKILKLVGK